MADRAKLLPLYEGAKPCVRSGYCCEQSACPFGEWDAAAQRCAFLRYDGARAICGKFDEITALPEAAWWLAPAFGAGCCSPLNSKRRAILKGTSG